VLAGKRAELLVAASKALQLISPYQSLGPVTLRLPVLAGAVGIALGGNICIRQTRPMPSPLRSVLGIGNRG
jgi:hypothetical protein